ncbi:MAG: peptidoglycan-binding protein, partial [Clostridia bacterium]|nr:peptidoglycan-binding protein [Clostridia bacterium]
MFFRNNRQLFKSILSLFFCALILLSCMPEDAHAAASGVTNAKVVLRQKASTSSKALQTLYEGTEVSVLKTSSGWYKVRYGQFTGYVMAKYLDVQGAAASSSSSSTSTSSSSTGTSAASKIRALGTAPGIMVYGDANSDVKKLQQALQILGYYKGSIDGRYGEGTRAAVKSYQSKNGLEADGVAGERTVKKLFGSCNAKSLSTNAGKTTTATSSSSQTVSSVSQLGSAPAISRLYDKGSHVRKLQQALECLGYYKGEIDGVYGEATFAAVKKFQSKRKLEADGVAGPATIRAMFGMDAAGTKYETEVLDWYDDNVTRVIPKGARFTVKDIGSGKTFEMVRWSGGDHMDAEPRSASDTATIKSIYGGSFSWRRRPILIKYNGHV